MPLEKCATQGCGRTGVAICCRCGSQVCERHLVTDDQHRPGGQRPSCTTCDRERREAYQLVRRHGLRAILWSGGGAIVGALAGEGIGHLITTDSFAHTVTTDLGFVLGLSFALYLALTTTRSQSAPTDRAG